MADEIDISKLTDAEFFLHAYRNNQAAVNFVFDLQRISHVLDDLIDRDKPVSDDQVRDAFWRAIVGLPANQFYMDNLTYLHPLVTAALANWQIANVFEQCGPEERNIAHSMRYDLITVYVMVAFMIGGRKWGEAVGPEIRRRCQRQGLAEYLAELEKRYPDKAKKETDQ